MKNTYLTFLKPPRLLALYAGRSDRDLTNHRQEKRQSGVGFKLAPLATLKKRLYSGNR